MADVRIQGVTKSFGETVAIDDLDLTIKDGEFVVLLGPTGAGKTTTLRLIAGLERPDSGTIHIGGHDATALSPAERDTAFVFQQYSLYPHLSVFDNLAFPLRSPARRFPEEAVRRRVEEVARMVRIDHKLDNRSTKLSGGEMQRVAIGRALVRKPAIYLMDEPLSSLDAKLRADLRLELKRIQSELGATMLYVTHDQIEAMSLADRIVIMHEGVLQQVGTPDEVYSHPANLFVAQFVGSPVMNVAEAKVAEKASAASVTVGDAAAGFEFPQALLSKLNGHAGGQLTLGIRPEGVLVRREAADGFLPVEAQIIEPLGSFDIVDLKVGSKMLRARTKSGFISGPGEKVYARIDPSQAHFFDAASGKSLGVRL